MGESDRKGSGGRVIAIRSKVIQRFLLHCHGAEASRKTSNVRYGQSGLLSKKSGLARGLTGE